MDSQLRILAMIKTQIIALRDRQEALAEDYLARTELSNAIAILHTVSEQVERGIRQIDVSRTARLEDPDDEDFEATAYDAGLEYLQQAFEELRTMGVEVVCGRTSFLFDYVELPGDCYPS